MKDILQCAREEAMRLGHRYIGTKHILLGALREGKAARVLADLNIDLEGVRQAVTDMVPTHTDIKPGTGQLPVTMRARSIFHAAKSEARAQGLEEADVEHLLLALLKDADSASSKVLREMGLSYDVLKQRVA